MAIHKEGDHLGFNPGDDVYHISAKQTVIGKVTAVLTFPEGTVYQVQLADGEMLLMPGEALMLINPSSDESGQS